MSGSATDLVTVLAANDAAQITGLENNVVTVSGTGSVDAADLLAIDAATSGLVTHTATIINGSYTDIMACYTSDEANSPGLAGSLNQALFVNDANSMYAALRIVLGKEYMHKVNSYWEAPIENMFGPYINNQYFIN